MAKTVVIIGRCGPDEDLRALDAVVRFVTAQPDELVCIEQSIPLLKRLREACAALSDAGDPFTHTQTHVAGGIVAVQLGITADEGVDRLRAYADACGRRISSVAADIIARRLTLHDQPNPPHG